MRAGLIISTSLLVMAVQVRYYRHSRDSSTGLSVQRKSCPIALVDSTRLVDFALGLVIFVLNLPNGQVLFLGEIQITEGF